MAGLQGEEETVSVQLQPGGQPSSSLGSVKLPGSQVLAKHNILLESHLFVGVFEMFVHRGFS